MGMCDSNKKMLDIFHGKRKQGGVTINEHREEIVGFLKRLMCRN